MDVKYFVLLLFVCRVDFVQLKKFDQQVSIIGSVLKHNLAGNVEKLDFISCGSKNSESLIKNLLRHSSDSFSVKIRNCNTPLITLNSSSFWSFDSIKIFRGTFKKIRWQLYRHLVHIFNATLDDVAESFGIDPLIDNVAFLLNETDRSIDLVTSFMFTEKKCRKNQFVTINEFNKATMKWSSGNFYPNKHNNFYKCPMIVLKMAKENIENIFDAFLSVMSQTLNFTVQTSYAESKTQFEKAFFYNENDFYKAVVDIRESSWRHVILTQEKAVFIVPQGEPLTQLEKLLSPFDFYTWTLIAATLLICIALIQIVGLSSKVVRNLSFGVEVQSPTMNILNIFLCGGQTKVPRTFSARFMFLNFLFWSLCIRTCFQSLSYRALQLDNRHPPMKTIEDLKLNNFTQYVFEYNEASEKDLENNYYG